MTENKISNIFPIRSNKKKPQFLNPNTSLESKYWKSFKSQQTPNLISPTTSLSFSPIPPHPFVISLSTSLLFFHPNSLQTPNSTISGHHQNVFLSSSFRSDGALLASGDQSGLIQVFDIKSRSALRRLSGHSRPVRLVKYPISDHLHLFSGSDDSLLKYWDIVSEKEVAQFSGHRDYIRSGSNSFSSPYIFATGSYDHTIRLWDVRAGEGCMVMEMNHGDIVEDVTFLPGGGLMASAGGNGVKLWDVVGGGRVINSIETHTKSVTSICVGNMKKNNNNGGEGEEYRLMSVGLDGYMKVFDYTKMVVTHSMRFPAPLLCIGLSPDCDTRVVCSSNGIMFAGRRKKKKEEKDEKEKDERKKKGFRYYRRGENEGREVDYVVMKKKRGARLGREDKLLKKFRHKEALLWALKEGRNGGRAVGVIEELVGRGRLLKSVMNLGGGEEELGLLLKFLKRKCVDPANSGLVMGLAMKVVELRGDDIRASRVLKGLVSEMKRMVNEEINFQLELQKIQGMISPLLSLSGRR